MGTGARRSPRIPLAIQLIFKHDDQVIRVKTITVNAHGALVESSKPLFVGADLKITNVDSAENATAWVVFTRESEKRGYFCVGFEFLRPAPTFWGSKYRSPRST